MLKFTISFLSSIFYPEKINLHQKVLITKALWLKKLVFRNFGTNRPKISKIWVLLIGSRNINVILILHYSIYFLKINRISNFWKKSEVYVLNVFRMMDEGLSKSKSVYLFTERQLPSHAETTGATNLLDQHGLSKAYEKYCNKKATRVKVKCFKDSLFFSSL